MVLALRYQRYTTYGIRASYNTGPLTMGNMIVLQGYSWKKLRHISTFSYEQYSSLAYYEQRQLDAVLRKILLLFDLNVSWIFELGSLRNK